MASLTALDDRAERARVALYERYDRLNELWLQAEEQLTSYHLTRVVHHAYSEPLDKYDNPMGCHYLGLEKINGKWRLCHGYEHYTAPDAMEWKPITDCSVEVRREAAKHLAVFQEQVIKSIEDYVPEIDGAISELEQFVYQGKLSRHVRGTPNGKAK